MQSNDAKAYIASMLDAGNKGKMLRSIGQIYFKENKMNSELYVKCQYTFESNVSSLKYISVIFLMLRTDCESNQ